MATINDPNALDTSLADAAYNEVQQQTINALSDYWNNNVREDFIKSNQALLYGVQDTPEDLRRKELIAQAKKIGVPSYEDNITPDVANTIVQFQLENNPQAYAKERAELKEVEDLFGTTLESGKDVRAISTYNAYMNKMRDNTIPLDVLTHPLAKALSPSDFDKLNNIVVLSNPEWRDYQDRIALTRMVQYNRDSREDAAALESGALSPKDYLLRTEAREYLESDTWFLTKAYGGLANMVQNVAQGVEDLFMDFVNHKVTSPAAIEVLRLPFGGLARVAYKAASYDTSKSFAQSTANAAIKTGMSVSDVIREQAVERETINALGASLFAFGFGLGKVAATGANSLLSKTLTKLGAESAGKFLTSKAGAAVGELGVGYLGNLTAMQVYQGATEGAVTHAQNELLNESASVMGAAIRGLGANLAENAGAAAFFTSFTGLGVGVKFLRNKGNVDEVETAVAVANEGADISTSAVNPKETAEVVDTTFRQVAQTSEQIYISANDLLDTLNENKISLESLTPEQQAILGDLQSKAGSGEDIILTVGQYSQLFAKDETLHNLFKNNIRTREDGFSINEVNQFNAKLDEDLSRSVEQYPELATTELQQREAIMRAAQQSVSDEIVFDINNAIADVNVEGLNAQTITKVAQDVASFIVNLMELCNIPSDQIASTFKANRPKFKFLEEKLDISNEQLGGANKGTYDAATNTISLRNDGDVITLMHEVSHYYLETIMTMADNVINNPTLAALRNDVLERYGLKEGYKGWANVDAATKQRIHEEFAYANIISRVDGLFKASDEVNLDSQAYRAGLYLNRALATTIIKNHFGAVEREGGKSGKIKQDQMNQALALEQQDFTTNYGYDASRFSDSPLLATLNTWANRGLEGHRITELNPLNDANLDINAFRGTVPDELLEQYQKTLAQSDAYIDQQAQHNSMLNAKTFYKNYNQITRKIKQAIANDPAIRHAKEEADKAQAELTQAQKEVEQALRDQKVAQAARKQERNRIDDLRKRKAASKQELAAMETKYKADRSIVEDKNKQLSEARAKASQADKNLKAANHKFESASKLVKERIASFEKYSDDMLAKHERIVQEVTHEFDDPKSELRTNWDTVENKRQALQSAPLLLSDLEQMGLPSAVIENLIDNGLVVDKYADDMQGAITLEVWRSHYQGNIMNGIKEMGRHTNREKTIAKVSDERYEAKHNITEVQDALITAQRKATSVVIEQELDIVNHALGESVAYTSSGGKVKTSKLSVYISKSYRAAVGNLKYNNSSPQQLVARANRARNLALRKIQRGGANNLKAARDLLQTALNLNEMAIEAARITQRIDNALTRFRKRFAGEFGKNYDKDTLEAAQYILHRAGLSTRKGNRARLEDLKRLNPDAADLVDRIANDTTNTMYYKEMTNGDLLKLITAVDNVLEKSREIKALADEADKALRESQASEIKTKLGEAIASDPAAAKRLTEVEVASGGPNEKSPSKWMQIVNVFRNMRHNSTKVSYLCQKLDGSYHNGPMYNYVYRPMREAQTQYNKDSIAMATKLSPVIDKLQHLDDDLKGKAIRVEFVANDPKALKAKKVTQQVRYLEADTDGGVRRKLVGYMLHLGNNENFDALARSLGMRRETLLAKIHELEEQGIITKDMWDICEAIWDGYASVLDKAQEACYKIEGRRFKKAQARTIVSSHGTYKGGYVPISILNREIKTESMADLTSNFNKSLPTNKHTKDRVVHYHEIDATVEAAIRGLDEQLRYADILPAANQVYSLVTKTDSQMARQLDAVDPNCVKEVLEPWLINTARQGGGQASPTLRAVHRWISAPLNTSILALDVANAAQQLTGILVAGLRTPPSALLWAMMPWVTNPIGAKAAREIGAVSPFMQTRFEMNGNNMALLQQRVTTTTTLGGVRNWLNNHAYILQYLTQRYVDSVVWQAKYASEYKQQLAKGVEPEQAKQVSIDAADDTVRSTQGSFDVVDASVTENSLWSKVITPFTNYFLTMSNLNAAEVGVRTAQHKTAWSIASSKVYTTLLAVIVPTTIGTFIAQGLKGKWSDDDKEMSDFLAEAGPLSWIKAYALGKNPWAGAAASAVLDTLFNGKYTNNSLLSPPIATTATTFSRGLDHLYQSAIGERDFTPTDLDSLGRVTALIAAPTPNTIRYLNFYRMMAMGEVDTSNPADLLRGMLTGRASKKQLE